MNYQFSNLLGAPYRGGSLVFHGQELLSPVGNRISQINLAHSTSQTYPFENLTQIRTLAISPNGGLMLSIDADGRALLINKKQRALLHHFSFKGPVAAAKFSPDGQLIAVAVGKLLQVWRTPGFERQVAPMQLHRTYGGCHDDITSLDWSSDGQFIAVASKDLTCRLFSLHPIPEYQPPTLSGHKDSLVGVYFTSRTTQDAAQLLGGADPVHLYTVSRDGALFGWTYKKAVTVPAPAEQDDLDDDQVAQPLFAGGAWSITSKHYFMQRGASVSAVDFHAPTGVLVACYSHGIFELYQLPEFTSIHTLSISRERISAVRFNAAGDWLALGCAKLGQLLVWEWRSETYVLKQQGHYFDVAAAAFSPDGAILATGADDCKVKLYQMNSGFCFVSFTEHTAPVSGLQFLPSGHALLTASLDGTVRAWDLVRYRNFRTMTSPEPVQFASLAVDPAGEIVCAGTLDTFQVYVWSLKTGRLLDVLSSHEGPVVGLSFSPTQPLLASCSWDRTVRTWDVFNGKGAVEVLQHGHDVLALAHRPDGKQLATATLDGQIYLWQPVDAELQGTIECRRDIRGGRLQSDRRAAGNLSSGACFTSLAYSADGSFLLAGGDSKYVCVYDVGERVMLQRFQVSHNAALDGVLDVLNSRHMTDAGPLQLINDHDEDEVELLPATTDAAAAADVPGAAQKRPRVRTRCVCLSPTNRSWAAATTEGVLVYSLDESLTFDPTDLTEDLTPAAFQRALAAQAFVRAVLIALRLGDRDLIRHAVFATPRPQIATVAAAVPKAFVVQLLEAIAEMLGQSPHLEYLLEWVRAMCRAHAGVLQSSTGSALPLLRSLQKATNRLHADLASACENNLHTLDYLTAMAAPPA